MDAEEFVEHVRSCVDLNASGDLSAADVVSEVCEMLGTMEGR